MKSSRLPNRVVAGLAVAAFAFSALAANANDIPEFIKPVPKPIQFEGTQAGARLVQATALIRAAEARTTYQVDGAGLAAAVLDTGLRTTHVDFAGRVIAQRNFTSNNGGNANNATDGDGHGTNVCGVIMAHGNHTGIASGANIVPVKVLDNNGSGSFSDIEAGIDWVIANRAALNITVVNLSLGDSSNGTTVGSSSFRTKIQQLRTARVAVVIAAGNDFFENNSQQGMSFPGIIPECVSVGCVYDANVGAINYGGGLNAFSTGPGRITPFSQRLHPNVSAANRTDIFAPGAPMTSSGIGSDTGSSTMEGTSQATPCAAGVILLLQQHVLRETGQLPTVDQIETWLRSGSVTINDGDDEDDSVVNTGLNFPRIDALAALQATGIAPPGSQPPSGPAITQQPQSVTVTEGQAASFTVAASGSGSLSYQWQRNNANISGATGSTYNIAATVLSDNGAQFRCLVTDSNGTATSNNALLTVNASGGSGAVELASGVSVNGSVAQGVFKHFFINVPSGATKLVVQTTNASADVDLYVRKGAEPTTGTYDFRPYLSTGNESVTVDGTTSPALSAGVWYCSVYGYAAGSFTITATVTEPAPPPPPPPPSGAVELASGVSFNGSVAQGAFKHFFINVPSGATKLVVQTTNATGDVDLYVRKSAEPTTGTWDFRPYTNSGNETVTVDGTTNPALGAGAWYCSVYGYAAGSFTITATVTEPAPPPPPPPPSGAVELASSVPANGSVAQGAFKHFFINVPSGATQLVVKTTNATGDVDLYVRKGAEPTTGTWDFRPYTNSGNETVTVTSSTNPALSAGAWYCSVYGYAAGSFTITATVTLNAPPPSGATELASGVPANGSVARHAWRDYFITVPAGATKLVVKTTNASGDVDLYVRKGAPPTASTWDFRPYTYSGNETVTVTGSTSPALTSGVWYCSVYGYAAGSYTITATVTVPALGSSNEAPSIQSLPTVSPNPAAPGQTVAFAAAAADPDGDAVTYAWDFGDGSGAAGATPTHAFAAAGIYQVQLVVTDGELSSTEKITVYVQNEGEGGGSLLVTAAQLKLNFAKDGKDQAKLKAFADLPFGAGPEGLAGTVFIGGVARPFVLDNRGRGFLPDGTIKVNFARGTIAVALKNGSFARAWDELGLANDDLSGVPVSVPVGVTLDGQTYSANANLLYSARLNKSGRAR